MSAHTIPTNAGEKASVIIGTLLDDAENFDMGEPLPAVTILTACPSYIRQDLGHPQHQHDQDDEGHYHHLHDKDDMQQHNDPHTSTISSCCIITPYHRHCSLLLS